MERSVLEFQSVIRVWVSLRTCSLLMCSECLELTFFTSYSSITSLLSPSPSSSLSWLPGLSEPTPAAPTGLAFFLSHSSDSQTAKKARRSAYHKHNFAGVKYLLTGSPVWRVL